MGFGELRFFHGHFLLFKLMKIARYLYFKAARFSGGGYLVLVEVAGTISRISHLVQVRDARPAALSYATWACEAAKRFSPGKRISDTKHICLILLPHTGTISRFATCREAY
jgi:hypothetical protein